MNQQDDNHNDPLLLDHSYDGIRELDNPLPTWWLATFFATIFFSFIYFIHYHTGGPGLSSDQSLNQELRQLKAGQVRSSPPQASQGDLLALGSDPEALKIGSEEFKGRCAACHGDKAQGLIGPNLTDNFWIHGSGEIGEVASIIRLGVLDKGMPAWENVVSSDRIDRIAAYIHSVKGSNPPGAKPPEGKEAKSK